MLGLMMDRPLLVSNLIEHAGRYHADAEIVSRTVEGPIHRTTYAEAERRAKKVANALTALGIRPGDRVATLAWNGYRHFELYFGISGIGAVCHTIHPRLFHEQIEYIHSRRGPRPLRRSELRAAGREARRQAEADPPHRHHDQHGAH